MNNFDCQNMLWGLTILSLFKIVHTYQSSTKTSKSVLLSSKSSKAKNRQKPWDSNELLNYVHPYVDGYLTYDDMFFCVWIYLKITFFFYEVHDFFLVSPQVQFPPSLVYGLEIFPVWGSRSRFQKSAIKYCTGGYVTVFKPPDTT